ncbi:MAG: fumarylacetoacetate hydrolase family protein [Defluviitaleaceae bacterium]|nr:fumarylacetoacetate hydrolase family protein [Defluviitaleaceae bacterium]
MKLSTFIYNGLETSGVEVNGTYYTFYNLLGGSLQYNMLDFIRDYETEQLPDFGSVVEHGAGLIPISANELVLEAPIPRPFRNIICVGKNYADHAQEVQETIQTGAGLIPNAPIYFTKTALPAMGDKKTIPLHSALTQQVDYEVELGVVIGKIACKISREQAESVIFGYTIINDITARDLQQKHDQWFYGKSLDGFCAIGPHIVTRDEIPFPVALDITCRVNGEIRQQSNTSKLIFDIPRLISELSQGITLYPGDIIATGTPAGIGHAMMPPQYLKGGDVVECEIEGIGVLTNYF